MENQIRVLLSIEIPQMSEYVDIDSIRKKLNNYAKKGFLNLNIKDLEGWRVLINLLFQRTDVIAISKRTARFSSDKEVAIYISIPIPNNEQITYGLSIVKEAFLKVGNEKYSHIFLPEFSNYNDLYSYILESSKQAIDLAFTKGFTCNGKKIKFQK